MSSRSSSRISSAMQCPICYNVLHPPIHLCKNGHGICGDCYEKVEITTKSAFPTCPLCCAHFQFLSIAASFVEIIYNFMEVNCKYFCYGCRVVLKGNLMRRHMEECKHKPKQCPRREIDACFWEGHGSLLEKHFRQHHQMKR